MNESGEFSCQLYVEATLEIYKLHMKQKTKSETDCLYVISNIIKADTIRKARGNGMVLSERLYIFR